MQVSGITPFTMLDYPEHTACVLFLPGCNIRCKFCHNSEFVLPEKLQRIRDTFISEDAVYNFLNKRVGKLEGVVISGGEPTVHADLHSFISKIRSLGFKIKLDTNGNNPIRVKALFDEGLIDYIAMDVKTSLASYTELVGPRINTELISMTMELIRERGVPYEFRSTLIREFHTSNILLEMSRLFTSDDILYLQQFRSGTTLDPAYQSYHGYTKEEMHDIAAQYFDNTKHTYVRI